MEGLVSNCLLLWFPLRTFSSEFLLSSVHDVFVMYVDSDQCMHVYLWLSCSSDLPLLLQERLLSNQQSDLEAIRGSITSLQTELGTELLSQLDPHDQKEVSL